MATFPSATAAALFCFFTLSLALNPLNTPENDDVATAASLLLPDANPIVSSHPSEPVNADDNPLSLSTVASTAVPLISLRPFNRRFSKFPCRHHRHKFYKTLEIPYGNDMVVSSGENGDFQDPEALHDGSWQQVNHHNHHHHHHHDEDGDSDHEDDDRRMEKMALKRRYFGGLDVEKKLKKHFRHENTDDEEENDHEKDKDGFMIRVRKFADHYF